MKVTFDVTKEIDAAIDWAAKRPIKVSLSFCGLALVSSAGAIGTEGYSVPFAIVALLAITGIIAVAARASQGAEAEPPPTYPQVNVDQLSEQRGDLEHYDNTARLVSRLHSLYTDGVLRDPVRGVEARNNFLEGILAAEILRLGHLGLERVSIVVLRRDEDHYLVRRACGPIKLQMSRGDRCPADRDLDEALLDYANHSRHAWVSCFGHYIAIAVVSDRPFGPNAAGDVARIATAYQGYYNLLRIMEQTPPLDSGSTSV